MLWMKYFGTEQFFLHISLGMQTQGRKMPLVILFFSEVGGCGHFCFALYPHSSFSFLFFSSIGIDPTDSCLLEFHSLYNCFLTHHCGPFMWLRGRKELKNRNSHFRSLQEQRRSNSPQLECMVEGNGNHLQCQEARAKAIAVPQLPSSGSPTTAFGLCALHDFHSPQLTSSMLSDGEQGQI